MDESLRLFGSITAATITPAAAFGVAAGAWRSYTLSSSATPSRATACSQAKAKQRGAALSC